MAGDTTEQRQEFGTPESDFVLAATSYPDRRFGWPRYV